MGAAFGLFWDTGLSQPRLLLRLSAVQIPQHSELAFPSVCSGTIAGTNDCTS